MPLLKIFCRKSILKRFFNVEIMKSFGAHRPELWLIFVSSILTVYEVTERFVSSSIWRKVEKQFIAVLHSRQCHCSTSRTAIYSSTAQQTVSL
jgi:hypothetical protein